MKFVKTNDGNIAAFVKGKSYYLVPSMTNYDKLYEALKNKDLYSFESNLVNSDSLSKYCEGFISFSNGAPTWDGVIMPDLFTDRILDLVTQGYEFGPMILFTMNLAENPSDKSIVELLDFLRNKNLPITKDGHFLGYKAVSGDYKDLWTGKIDNSVGATPSMKREDVDDNRHACCSYGLHVGAFDYAKDYGSINVESPESGTNRLIIVKVNPRDVITVPTDASFQKLRCCRYTVVAKFSEVLDKALYDDAMLLPKNDTVEQSPLINSVLENKPEGWREKLRAKFERIKRLMFGA